MRVTVQQIKEMKELGTRIPMITAYDYPTAKLVDEVGLPVILVGDSLGMAVLGYDSTLPVTMEEMLHHTRAVARGAQRALIVGDMPFMSYQRDLSLAVGNAGRFLQEGGCQAVKLEGGVAIAETIQRIVEVGIPVMGHIGLTPQSVHQLGGFKVQGKDSKGAARLLRDAHEVEQAGAFAVVLEGIPAQLSELISQQLSIPTIGIGAGAGCDGQVQVIHDILGLFTDFVPKHAKQYIQLAELIKDAVKTYAKEVQDGTFPTEKESFLMEDSKLAAALAER
jgi:3-methyl-2-oxobutanoate hydroxymethyltransferase